MKKSRTYCAFVSNIGKIWRRLWWIQIRLGMERPNNYTGNAMSACTGLQEMLVEGIRLTPPIIREKYNHYHCIVW